MNEILVYLAVGATTGIAAGLLGVGGGFIIVPGLAHLMPGLGVSSDLAMHLAIGTSLATIVVTSLSSIRAHHRRGAVLWPVVARMTPAILLGAAVGALVADQLRGDSLRAVFGSFALVVSAQMWFGAKPKPHRGLPGWGGMSLAGGVIGVLSAIIGIGGGSLTVPFLAWCNVVMRNAVATSAAVGLPIAVGGALAFIAVGWGHPALPEWSSGYVYWPAVLGVVLPSVLLAPLGARWAHSLPTAVLKKGFAVFLALLGVKMLLG